jgi:hypothetical protein
MYSRTEMKTPFVFLAVGADFASISACAVGGTVREGIPDGDAADQARMATELSVEVAATVTSTPIEEVNDECRGPRREGLVPQIGSPRHGSPSQGRDQQEHNWQTAEALPNGSISPRGLKPSRAPQQSK